MKTVIDIQTLLIEKNDHLFFWVDSCFKKKTQWKKKNFFEISTTQWSLTSQNILRLIAVVVRFFESDCLKTWLVQNVKIWISLHDCHYILIELPNFMFHHFDNLTVSVWQFITCQHLGYSQSRSSPSKLCCLRNSTAWVVNRFRDSGLETSREYLSPSESFQPPRARRTFLLADFKAVTLL